MTDPTPEQIAEWKRQYDELFTVEIGKHLIIYRAVTFREFDQIASGVTQDSSSVDIEDELVNLAVLAPDRKVLDRMRAGHVSAVADAIKESSCLDGEVYRAKDVLQTWRSRVSGIRGEMYAFVMFAMPQYKAADLDNLTFYRLAELVALAEKVVSLRQAAEGIETEAPIRLELYTPEEIEAINEQLSNTKISKHGNATMADPIAQKLMAAM